MEQNNLFSSQLLQFMLKRTKIVNISITSPNDISANHFHEKRNEYSHKMSDCHKQQLIHNCYEAIRIIVQSKNNLQEILEKEGRMTQIFHQTKSKQQAYTISLPLSIAESVLNVLKQFLTFKTEQKQQQLKSQSSKCKITSDKITNIKLLINQLNKENGLQQMDQSNAAAFRMIKNSKIISQKFEAKIKQLQTQLFLFKEKLDQKNAIISQLISKEVSLKNKYNSQLNKIIRNKNISNVNSNFIKGLEKNRREHKPLLNIIGRNGFQNEISKQIEDNDSKNTSQGEPLDYISKDCTINNQKNDYASIQKTSATDNLFKTTDFSKKNTERGADKVLSASYSIPNLKKNKKKKKSDSTFRYKNNNIVKLKEELSVLMKRKNIAVDQLNENSHKIERQLQKIENEIAEKKKLINEVHLNLDENVQHKQTNHEFEALQMDGFYHNQARPFKQI